PPAPGRKALPLQDLTGLSHAASGAVAACLAATPKPCPALRLRPFRLLYQAAHADRPPPQGRTSRTQPADTRAARRVRRPRAAVPRGGPRCPHPAPPPRGPPPGGGSCPGGVGAGAPAPAHSHPQTGRGTEIPCPFRGGALSSLRTGAFPRPPAALLVSRL